MNGLGSLSVLFGRPWKISFPYTKKCSTRAFASRFFPTLTGCASPSPGSSLAALGDSVALRYVDMFAFLHQRVDFSSILHHFCSDVHFSTNRQRSVVNQFSARIKLKPGAPLMCTDINVTLTFRFQSKNAGACCREENLPTGNKQTHYSGR